MSLTPWEQARQITGRPLQSVGDLQRAIVAALEENDAQLSPWVKTADRQPSVLDGQDERFIVTAENEDGHRITREATFARNLKLDWWNGYWGAALPNSLAILPSGDCSFVIVNGWLSYEYAETEGEMQYMPVDETVIAWMPFPTPLEKESEE